MNDDLISRQALLESIERISVKGNVLDDDWVYRFIQEFPSAERKRIRGKWIYGEKRKFIDLANADLQYKMLGYPHRPYINMKCSSCHKITIVDETIQYNFCPHCGADMRKQKLQYGDEDTSQGGLMSAT